MFSTLTNLKASIFQCMYFAVVYSEIEKKFSTMCFTLRSMEDEKRARLGIVECVKHNLCTSFPVMWEKDGKRKK